MVKQILRGLRFRLDHLWFWVVERPALAACGSDVHLFPPYRLEGAAAISIGAATSIQRGAWLYCMPVNQTRSILRIGAGCMLGYNNHIAAVQDVVIEDEVLTANNVYISDNIHSYEDIQTPIIRQPIRFKGHVTIGRGTWLGENVVVIGASVGRNCVIGANAVVTRNVPDHCVAVGSPAIVIRHYDSELGRWLPGPPTATGDEQVNRTTYARDR